MYNFFAYLIQCISINKKYYRILLFLVWLDGIVAGIVLSSVVYLLFLR